MSVSSELEWLIASGEFARMVGRQPANAKAYSGGSTTFAIGNVARSVGRAALAGLGGNVTVSATSFGSLSTPLTLEVDLTGRPLKVTASGAIASGAGGFIFIDITLRGVRVSGATNGLAFSDRTASEVVTAVEMVESPDPGPAVLEVVAFRTIADGFILADGSNRFVLLAEEL